MLYPPAPASPEVKHPPPTLLDPSSSRGAIIPAEPEIAVSTLAAGSAFAFFPSCRASCLSGESPVTPSDLTSSSSRTADQPQSSRVAFALNLRLSESDRHSSSFFLSPLQHSSSSTTRGRAGLWMRRRRSGVRYCSFDFDTLTKRCVLRVYFAIWLTLCAEGTHVVPEMEFEAESAKKRCVCKLLADSLDSVTISRQTARRTHTHLEKSLTSPFPRTKFSDSRKSLMLMITYCFRRRSHPFKEVGRGSLWPS